MFDAGRQSLFDILVHHFVHKNPFSVSGLVWALVLEGRVFFMLVCDWSFLAISLLSLVEFVLTDLIIYFGHTNCCYMSMSSHNNVCDGPSQCRSTFLKIKVAIFSRE